MRIAIVGTGISGLLTAYLLSSAHDLTIFEANGYIGGHTRTVDVSIDGDTYRVDTGFIVYNEENYPNFTRLLQKLEVETQPSLMSFSVRCEKTGLEYNGTSLNRLFAQRKNLLRPSFYIMIRDIARFYRESIELLEADDYQLTLGDYLRQKRYSDQFIEHHIVPMGSAIWSSGTAQMRRFPARLFVEFFYNHGFLRLQNRPAWRTVRGGSSRYVDRLVEGFKDRIRLNCRVVSITRGPDVVRVTSTMSGEEEFDQVVLATHSDQALRILADIDPLEKDILGKIEYKENRTILHTDSSLMPRNRRAWASWNYYIPEDQPDDPKVTYYMNSLQSIQSATSFCVTLNRAESIRPECILREMTYHHPVYSEDTVAAQNRWSEISGKNRTHFCGAYWGYGFHEDGVTSALRVCDAFGRRL